MVVDRALDSRCRRTRPAFAHIHSRIQRRHAARLRLALDRAARRGEIPSTADRYAIAATLLGPLLYRRWFSGTVSAALAEDRRDEREVQPARQTVTSASRAR